MNWYDKYVGVAYSENQLVPGTRDCYGLLVQVFQDEFGVVLPPHLMVGSSSEITHAILQATEEECWIPVELGKHRPKDVIVFKIFGVPLHVGVIVTHNRVLHTMAKTGAVIERFDTVVWKRRIAGVYRHERFAECRASGSAEAFQGRTEERAC